MKIQTWRILLLLVFVAMVLFGSAVIADNDISEWNAGDGKPDSEVDGTEGFGVDIGLNKQQGDASGEASTLEGVIDVDTYLNIRSGPWENIVGGFRTGEKIKIVSRMATGLKLSTATVTPMSMPIMWMPRVSPHIRGLSHRSWVPMSRRMAINIVRQAQVEVVEWPFSAICNRQV